MSQTNKVPTIRLRGIASLTALFIFIITQGYNNAFAQEPVEVWHAWQGNEADLLENLASAYPYAPVELIQFDSHEALLQTLQTSENEAPDLIIGPDTWANELDEIGLSGAFCLPGQCPECEAPNPPLWCQFASGDFSLGRNDAFMVAGLCDPEQCPECFDNNPPRWCWAADLPPETAPDFFQAAFSKPIDDNIYPIGFPIYWDALNIMVNIEWFVERELGLPTTTDEILALRQSYPDLIYNAVPEGSIQEEMASPEIFALYKTILYDDPSPQPSKAGLLFMWSSQFGELSQELGPLMMLPFDGYRSTPLVEGIYVNPETAVLQDALNFASQLTTPEAQATLFAENGRLPTGSAAWFDVAASDLTLLGESNLLGLINQLPEIDLPEFIERPPFEAPPFNTTPCGAAAAWLYEQFTDIVGLPIEELIKSEFDVRLFERLCILYMPEFASGTGSCATQAAYVFAQRLAELRGTTNAAGLAEEEARLSYEACISG